MFRVIEDETSQTSAHIVKRSRPQTLFERHNARVRVFLTHVLVIRE